MAKHFTKNKLRVLIIFISMMIISMFVFFKLHDINQANAAIGESSDYVLRVSYPFSYLQNGDTKTIEAKIFDRNGISYGRSRGLSPIIWSYRNISYLDNYITAPNGDSTGGMNRCGSFQSGGATWCYEENIDTSLPDCTYLRRPLSICVNGPDKGSKFYYKAQPPYTDRPYIFELVAQVSYEGKLLQAVARVQVEKDNTDCGFETQIIESSGIDFPASGGMGFWTAGQTATYDFMLRSREGNNIPINGKIDWTVSTRDYAARYVQDNGSFGYERHLEESGRRLSLTPNIASLEDYLIESSAKTTYYYSDCSPDNIEFEGNLSDSTITDTFTGEIPLQR